VFFFQQRDDADGVYVVGKQADDEPNRDDTNRKVTIDQYSGQVLHVQDRKKFSAGETFLEWQYPLHCGEAFGNIGRAFILVMGFVPLTLYVTGSCAGGKSGGRGGSGGMWKASPAPRSSTGSLEPALRWR
jgi:uncharacterized iron-regulated membrane protein